MKKTSCFVLTAGFIALSAVASAQLTLPLTDNFASLGNPDHDWVTYENDPVTSVVAFSPSAPDGDGFAFEVHDGTGHAATSLANDNGFLKDYRITAMIYLASSGGSDWGRVGIIARAQADSPVAFRPKGYYMMADSDGDGYLRVVAYGPDASWASVLFEEEDKNNPVHPVTRDAWHEFKLEVTGTSVTAHLDGVEIVSATDGTYTAPGRIAIYNYRATGSTVTTYVDRITIESTAPAAANDWAIYE